MTRPVALITGASAGIGQAFAYELAARGYDLVLTARRRERLEELAADIKRTHGARSHVVPADLADPTTPEALRREAASAGLQVDMLVNNAGYGVPGTLTSQPWPTHRDFIQVMMTAPIEVCWHFLPGMRERKRGTIINVASLAGLTPGSAGHTLYGASKSFLIRFSQSLALENATLGIKVSALCPGFTYSEFHDVTGTRSLVRQLPKWMWMSAEDVVREGLDAAAKGRVVHVTGRPNRLIKALVECLPDRAAEAMMRRQSRRFRTAD
jgi:short-subunit dehydrogenase